MFTKRTGIGIGVGSVIIGIGIYALITSIGLQAIAIDETFEVGESTSYQITAPNNAPQQMTIIGDKFDLELHSPADGLQMPKTTHSKKVELNWTHLADGQTKIELQNIGESELHVTGVLNVSTDPILFTYHFIVITAGVVIIGFS